MRGKRKNEDPLATYYFFSWGIEFLCCLHSLKTQKIHMHLLTHSPKKAVLNFLILAI